MDAHHKLLVAVIAAGSLTLGAAVPASADGPTSATVTVTAGFLEMTLPSTAGNLGTRANT